MKEIVLALKESIETRIKNKVFASFIIAWVIWNWKVISILLLSEREQMINIINGCELKWTDHLIIPFAMSALYVTLLQVVIYIPAFFSEKIENKISEFSSKNAEDKFKTQKKLNVIAIDAEYEYQKMKMIKELDYISEKNAILESQLKSLEESLNIDRGHLEEASKKLKAMEEESDRNGIALVNTRDNIKFLSSKIKHDAETKNNESRHLITTINIVMDALELIHDKLPNININNPYQRSIEPNADIINIIQRH